MEPQKIAAFLWIVCALVWISVFIWNMYKGKAYWQDAAVYATGLMGAAIAFMVFAFLTYAAVDLLI